MQDLKTFFEYLNDVSFPYVVLRNFDNLPHNVQLGVHSDLDLLVYDLDHFKEIFPEAKAEHPFPRVRFLLPMSAGNIYMDLRYVGDGYYPEDFEREILNNREKHPNGFFTPDPVRFRIALAYHAVHHKAHIGDYSRWLGNVSVDDLYQALKASSIGWSQPQDPSVGQFNAYWKGATAIAGKDGDSVIKTQISYKDYDLIGNEARILAKCDSRHFPKVLSQDKDSIRIEDCGSELTIDNLPVDWKEQLVDILGDLKKFDVQHRDIKPDNLLVKDGVIKLIDFGWARFYTDDPDDPPSCLGFPYKPSWGFNDTFSMRQVIKKLEFQKEERDEEKQ
jgi:hypothetical protein